jgi:hypothetical protein
MRVCSKIQVYFAVSSTYNWSESSSPKSEAKDGAIGYQFQSLSVVFACAVRKECAEISYFNFKEYYMVL